jgi:carbon storage regulator
MLVLSRKRGEAIVVGGQITVTVLEVKGERVKLGFTAPTEVPIHRSEVFERVGDAWPEFQAPVATP